MATQTKPQTGAVPRESAQGLEQQGLRPAGEVHWNYVAPELIQAAIRRSEGTLADMGPFVAVTAPHTGRSPNDKFVVREPESEGDVDWGKVNQPLAPEKFDALLSDVRAFLNNQPELFVQDLYCGADPKLRLSVRYVTPSAWHGSFVRNMFSRPDPSELPTFEPTSASCTRRSSRPTRRSTARARGRSSSCTSAAARSSSAARATPVS